MLRTDDIPGAQPKRFTHPERGHVKEKHESAKLKTQLADPKPNAKGLESPFALYGTFDPSATGQKNMSQPERSSPKVVRRNVSMQIKSLLAPELGQSPVKGNHNQAHLTPQNGQIVDIVGFKPLPLRSNSQLSRSVSQKEGNFEIHGGNNYDSIDMLKSQVSEKVGNTPGGNNTPLKKALHNFYGVTPPDSRNSSYYRNFEIKRGNSGSNFNGMSDSYYHNKTAEIQERAQQNSGFNKDYKNFFGVSRSDSESFKHNYNQFYKDAQTPANLLDKQQSFAQPSLQQQVEQRLQQQRPQELQIQSNLNKSLETKFTLDPISHDKVYAIASPFKRGNLVRLSKWA